MQPHRKKTPTTGLGFEGSATCCGKTKKTKRYSQVKQEANTELAIKHCNFWYAMVNAHKPTYGSGVFPCIN